MLKNEYVNEGIENAHLCETRVCFFLVQRSYLERFTTSSCYYDHQSFDIGQIECKVSFYLLFFANLNSGPSHSISNILLSIYLG